MKKSASYAAILIVALSAATASAQGYVSGTNPRPQYVSGTNPRPQYVSGTNPRPQSSTFILGFGWFSSILGMFVR